MDKKECPHCKIKKLITDFSTYKPLQKGNWCKKCLSLAAKIRYKKNPEYYKNKSKQKTKKVKWLALQAYGGKNPKCACCKEKIVEFLTIDHINNDGAEERKKLGFGKSGGRRIYYYLKKNNYPQNNRYQVLCFNCNLAKSIYKQCPHSKSEWGKIINYLQSWTH